MKFDPFNDNREREPFALFNNQTGITDTISQSQYDRMNCVHNRDYVSQLGLVCECK